MLFLFRKAFVDEDIQSASSRIYRIETLTTIEMEPFVPWRELPTHACLRCNRRKKTCCEPDRKERRCTRRCVEPRETTPDRDTSVKRTMIKHHSLWCYRQYSFCAQQDPLQQRWRSCWHRASLGLESGRFEHRGPPRWKGLG